MGNLATFHRGKLFAPVSNTTFLHLELSTLISTMKTTSRYICGILYSFTLSRLIIDLLIVSSNFITDMHPAFKTVFALVVYLFGGVPARYAINSTYRWLGFHKGLQLSAASEYCKNLRFQAHYNRHHLTYLEELQHAWCLGEQEGVHCRPLYLYSLERTRYYIMQFLCTVLLIGLLVLLTRLRLTATNASAAGSCLDPTIGTTSVKHSGVDVSGPGRMFGSITQFFDRPSRKDVEVLVQQLAADKERIHMEDLAKAEESCNTKLEAMKFEYRQLGSSRDAEADRIVGDLEKELKDQQRATLEWKKKAREPCNTCSHIRSGSACKNCEVQKQKLQDYEVQHERMIAEIKHRDREEEKQARLHRPKLQPPNIMITSQRSTEEQPLRQRAHELRAKIKNAPTNTKPQFEIDLKTAKDRLEAQHNKNADLRAKVDWLERIVEETKTELTQAKTSKASRAATQERTAQMNFSLQGQLDQKHIDLRAKEEEVRQAGLQMSRLESIFEAAKTELTQVNMCNADLASQAATQEQAAQADAQTITSLQRQLDQKHFDLQAKEEEVRQAAIQMSILESIVAATRTELTQAKACNADLASKAATQAQAAQADTRTIASLQEQLNQKHLALRSKKGEVRSAESKLAELFQKKKDYETERDKRARHCADLEAENREYKAEREGLEKNWAERVEQEKAAFQKEYDCLLNRCRQDEESHKAKLDQLKKNNKAQYDELYTTYTNVKEKAQNDAQILRYSQMENDELRRRLQEEQAAKSGLHKEIGRLRNDIGDRMDETGDNTWVQSTSEAEMLLKSRDVQIKTLERKVRELELDSPGRTPVPLPQPRVVQPLRTSNIPSTPSALAGPSVTPNATPSDAEKRLDFAQMSEARVRKELSAYTQTALDSVLRWNKACFSGSAGADKVAKNFSTMLANWEYLQEDMIQDEKLLRAVKDVVALEGRWTTSPTPAEIMGGKKPVRDRMVGIAKLVLAKIEGTGQEEGGKGVKRMR